MEPWNVLAMEPSPDGKDLVLHERGGVYVIRVGGQELMSSARHGSEEALAETGLQGLRDESPSVLIGGLGLGYTLRAALDRLPSKASVTVVEISAAVVAWNRGPLAPLAGAPLSDSRVSVEVAEIGRFVATTRRRFDAILLDVDNGPSALFRAGNQALYTRSGLAAFSRALRPGGALVVWSAGAAPRFVEELRSAGFEAREQRVPARLRGGKARHVLFTGRLRHPRGRH
jgi:spermidine synthase